MTEVDKKKGFNAFFLQKQVRTIFLNNVLSMLAYINGQEKLFYSYVTYLIFFCILFDFTADYVIVCYRTCAWLK